MVACVYRSAVRRRGSPQIDQCRAATFSTHASDPSCRSAAETTGSLTEPPCNFQRGRIRLCSAGWRWRRDPAALLGRFLPRLRAAPSGVAFFFRPASASLAVSRDPAPSARLCPRPAPRADAACDAGTGAGGAAGRTISPRLAGFGAAARLRMGRIPVGSAKPPRRRLSRSIRPGRSRCPNDWIMGQAAGVAVDAQDHVWVIQRPAHAHRRREGARASIRRATKCCKPAPPVLEFDQDGTLLRVLGRPGRRATTGRERARHPGRPQRLRLDRRQRRRATASSSSSRPTASSSCRSASPAPQTDSRDTSRLGKPANVDFDPAANEVYVADGYDNHRIIVFDCRDRGVQAHVGRLRQAADRRQAGRLRPGRRPASQQFANPVHCVQHRRATGSSMSATAPTTASRCSGRTAAS